MSLEHANSTILLTNKRLVRGLLSCFLLALLIPLFSLQAEIRTADVCAELPDPYVLEIDNPFELYAIQTEVPAVERPNFRPRLGTYTYRVSWQGIGAANVKISVDQQDLMYSIHVRVETNDVVDVFYKLRYEATSFISASDFTPFRTHYQQSENSREKITQVVYHPNGQIESRYWSKNRDPGVSHFSPNSSPLDPFSAAFIARGLDWWEGRSVTFDTFNGKTRYLITLTAEERRYVTMNGKKRDVWVVSPSVRKSDESHPHKKIESAKIYVTADEHHEILKVESEVFVGTVETTLRSFVPKPEPTDGLQFASKKNSSDSFF